jgi:PhnB protein
VYFGGKTMRTVNIYLNFNGNCEEAFMFYKSVFRGEFRVLRKFKDIAQQEDTPFPSKKMEDKIMHISLPISKETVLMGSDTDGEWFGQGFRQGNNFSISIYTDKKEEADRLFHGLSSGGQVAMPMGNTFCGEYFGMFTDKFGINWMIGFNL